MRVSVSSSPPKCRLSARRVFLALEYQDRAADHPKPADQDSSRLIIVDAAQRAQTLRQRYPDPAKHAICCGSVRLALRRHDSQGVLLSPPRLAGWVEGLTPAEISVPRPLNQLLTPLHHATFEEENALACPPRFSACVHWGRNHQPWVDQIQSLGTPTPPLR